MTTLLSVAAREFLGLEKGNDAFLNKNNRECLRGQKTREHSQDFHLNSDFHEKNLQKK